ncbi:unnamed protein product, partial [Sphacelaria rigidula]
MPSITSGEKMRGNDTVPLSLACRTVAKAASRLAVDPGSNETEVQAIKKTIDSVQEKVKALSMAGKGGGAGFQDCPLSLELD